MSITTRYEVFGMTCGHCVGAVTEEISTLPGVETVDVELVSGGASLVLVTSAEALTEQQVREAVDEAGYTLVGTDS